MARKINTRQTNPTYLILVEGQTEFIYFQSLKETHRCCGFTVKLQQAKHSNPLPLIEEAQREFDKHVYKYIWCVYDCDVLCHDKPEKFDNIYLNALKQGIQFAESMPCIEVWFILHFKKPQNLYQDANAVTTDLKKHIPQYSKDQIWQTRNLYKLLKERAGAAFENAVHLPAIDSSHRAQTTATSVHKLVQIFGEE